jgi:hypothetical protein
LDTKTVGQDRGLELDGLERKRLAF